MKIKILSSSLLVILLLSIILLILKFNIPLNYKNQTINNEVKDYVINIQKVQKLKPVECAKKYLYYNTDHQNMIPTRIEIQQKLINNSNVAIIFYDPACDDDSIYSSIDKIYLIYENDIWKPLKHEWSHKGRGLFGWSTKESF